MYSTSTKKFTLKRCDKRPSTLKSLAPKKGKSSSAKKNIEKVGDDTTISSSD